MHPNEQLIQKFYQCFQSRDHKGMNACYHDDAEFSDMVFVELKGPQVKAMWQMLCERATDLKISASNIRADDERGQAYWEAEYTFSKTERFVHNKIDATFQFRDGKIIKHYDKFDLWKWASMALGASGMLLGWTPFVQNAIRKEASRNLQAFINKKMKVEQV